MSDQTDNITNMLKPYGLSEEEAKIYIFLLESGVCTALTISRELHIGRTKVYRILDKLKNKLLVEEYIKERGAEFGATDPTKFKQLLIEKELEVTGLKQSLPDVLQSLTKLSTKAQKSSKVLYYQGVEGLKQVSWNALRAKKCIRVYEVEHISDFLPADFSEVFRGEQVKRKITTKDLTNKSSFSGFTDVSELISHYSEFRYIPKNDLNIKFEALIYNDVYTTYTYKGEEVFCVEIHNAELADMQKQIFDFVWKRAKKMRFMDDRGGAKVE